MPHHEALSVLSNKSLSKVLNTDVFSRFEAF